MSNTDEKVMTKHIAMRIPNALHARINALTSDSGMSTSAFIRMAIIDRVRMEEANLRRLGVDVPDYSADDA